MVGKKMAKPPPVEPVVEMADPDSPLMRALAERRAAGGSATIMGGGRRRGGKGGPITTKAASRDASWYGTSGGVIGGF